MRRRNVFLGNPGNAATRSNMLQAAPTGNAAAQTIQIN
jgi:hypothetical protein